MRFKQMLAAGLVLALPVLITSMRVEADDLFPRLHHHRDCAADQTVVKLPAQEIRVETMRPRVVVNEVAPSHRMRGFFPQGQAVMPMVPMMHGPLVATVMPMTLHSGAMLGVSNPQCSTGSSMLEHAQALERQAAALSQARAARQAEDDVAAQALLRIQGHLNKLAQPAPTVKTSDTDIATRLDRIEKLLITHDNILQKVAPTLPKN
jgi:hypothetical protein